ncbi:MAG: hypothetical protein MI975_28555 [Cytophagales bacterium]|nr:hypothetical protein [Cytophagales bacterium]
MSKLPLVDAKTFEKVLCTWDLRLKDRKEAMYFTGILMNIIPHFLITKAEILADH